MLTGILLADDHALVRDGLRMIIGSMSDMKVIGEADNGRDAIRKAEELRPEVVVMDIAMPELNGIEATRSIIERLPRIRVIILSMYHTSEHVVRALQAGACGYLLKESAGAEVVKAVRCVIRGHKYFGRGVEPPKETFHAKGEDILLSPLDSLSQREREVLQYVVEGKTSAQIAEMLSLSPKSVETYRSRLMHKLDVDNIPALVKYAIQHGLTPAG